MYLVLTCLALGISITMAVMAIAQGDLERAAFLFGFAALMLPLAIMHAVKEALKSHERSKA